MSAKRAGGGFLDLLDEDERASFHERGRLRRFERGDALVYEGQVGDKVLVLLTGRAKVSSTTAEGREMVLGFRGPGDLVGELSVIDGRPRSSTVLALEPVEALAMAATNFRTFVEDHPRVAWLLLELLSARFRDADRKRIEFGAADSVGRVSARLVELAETHGEPEDGAVVITLPLSQEELGGWCGCSREAAAKGLQTLRRLGLIETRRRRIVVLDVDRLRERAS